MKWLKRIFYILIVALIGIQIIPIAEPTFSSDLSNDFLAQNEMPSEIRIILKNACYDCHSLQPELPWYANVAPVSWLVKGDISEGLSELNFSEWESMSKIKRIQKIESCSEVVESKEMPLPIYATMHSKAKLTDEQRTKFIEWAENFSETIFEK
ncbi:MAG: heme-binding domain-containing protein [Bacteroidales bacterium]|nr:heme-binding domain-containing protein [Bacteroidales bacterium]